MKKKNEQVQKVHELDSKLQGTQIFSMEKYHVKLSHIHWENHFQRICIEKNILRHLKMNRGSIELCVQSNILVWRIVDTEMVKS